MRNVVVKAAAWLLMDERARSSGITECMVFYLLCIFYAVIMFILCSIDILIDIVDLSWSKV